MAVLTELKNRLVHYPRGVPDMWRQNFPFTSDMMYRDDLGLKIYVTNQVEPVYPNLVQTARITPHHLEVPITDYIGCIHAGDKSGPLLSQLVEYLGIKEGFSFSSSPRKILEMAHNFEANDYTRDVGPDIIRTIMRFCWVKRLAQGEQTNTGDGVLSSLTTGPNIDTKTRQFMGQTFYEQSVDFFASRYKSTTSTSSSLKLSDGRIALAQKSYFLQPETDDWHEIESRFPAAPYSEMSFPDYDVVFESLGVRPVAKLTYMPIPNNPSMQYLMVELGLISQERLATCDFETIFPEPEMVTQRLHISPVTPINIKDLRNTDANVSWQRRVKGHIDVVKGTVRFSRQAIRSWNKPAELPTSAFDDVAFSIMETFRTIRAHITRDAVSDTEMDCSTQGVTVGGGEALVDGYFLEGTQQAIRDNVEKILQDAPNIEPQLRKEILSDIATSAIWAPIELMTILKRTKTFRWLSGLADFSENDVDEVIHQVYEAIVNNLTLNFYRNDTGQRESEDDRWWVHELYQLALKRPSVDLRNHQVSWEKLLDGMSAIVAAIDHVRFQKGLVVSDTQSSIISRFRSYFSFIF